MTERLRKAVESRLEEAIRVLELRRYRRIFASGRLPFVYASAVLLVSWLLAPFLFGDSGVVSGRSGISSFRGWEAGVLFTCSALAAGIAAYLRCQTLWHQEHRLHGFQAWILGNLSPGRTVVTTVAMSAVLGAALAAIPMGFGFIAALLSGLAWWQWLLELLLLGCCSLLGAALGAAVFFISYGLVPRAAFYPALLAFGLVVLALWLRIEAVESPVQPGWEQHPHRIARAVIYSTPLPAVFGAAAPGWWSRNVAGSVQLPIPAWAGGLLYAAAILAGAAYAAHAARRGYARLIEDLDRVEDQPRETTTEDGGREFYWKGFRNPVWTRDIRTRLRSKDTAEFIFFASIAVAAGAFVPLLLTASDLSDPLQTARSAREVFFWLTMTLVALVALIAPGLTADSVTTERANGTLELLVATPLRPRAILSGKLLGAVSVMLLLISPSLPLFGLCYLFHGASGAQVVQVYLLLVATVVIGAFIGLAQSAINAKSGSAKFFAYGTTAAFVAIPGGPFWIAAAFAAPQAEMRQSLAQGVPYAVIMGVLWAFVLVLFWGNACEQLEYSEY
ncbi:MAG: ABC transporter permease [Armatimonadota bacterium]